MNKKDCKIVQDLLPNYIDKLTTIETNEFIENHLKECKECAKILENMKKDFDIETKNKDKKVINFIKKYNKKMRILKLIILSIIVIYLAILGRKAVIMIDLINKSSQIVDDNEYSLYYSVYSIDSIYSINLFRKNDNYVRKFTFSQLESNNDTIIEEYGNGKISNYYLEKENGKKEAILNYEKDGVLPMELKDFCFSSISNKKDFIRNIFKTSITTIKRGEIQYYISNFLWGDFGTCDIYITESGLIKRVIMNPTYIGSPILGNTTIEVNYGITNEIMEDTLQKSDVSEYEIIEY